jgi:hypothetical protein
MRRVAFSRHGLVAWLVSVAITVVALVDPLTALAGTGPPAGM